MSQPAIGSLAFEDFGIPVGMDWNPQATQGQPASRHPASTLQ